MSLTFIPITEDAPALVAPEFTAGQLLSARERGVVSFRDRLTREISGSGPKRTSDHMAGYRRGFDEAMDFLRAHGVIR